ncbi:MAG: stage IV sporulation protein B [Bacilli bacterium]|nr:stage IV sporulation protein B [Bacilli bacterium]
MKKLIFTFFIILFLPYNIFAYSKNVIPGGESIGIKINSDGLIVVGYYKVDDEYIAKKNVKIGDKIIKINNHDVSSINELTKYINSEITEDLVISLKIIRNNKVINTNLKLKEENNLLKTGLYVKDNIIGLGTLTYIDPVTKVYGALGHDIVINETNNRVEVKDGNILLSTITSINKSRNGHVGSKNANISFDNKIGSIEKNLETGIFGFYTDKMPNKKTLEVGRFEDIKLDNAYILTVTKERKIEKYNIDIVEKYYNKRNTNKAFSFKIIDKKLIDKTGGIVQGMSGSPIIQNNKLIGAVTNVVIDRVNYGYGISIDTMLKDGDTIIY